MSRWTVQGLQNSSWFQSLLMQIEAELHAMSAGRHDNRPALENELEDLGKQIQGWSLSLAKPDLSTAVRETLEKNLDAAIQRRQGIEQQLAEIESLPRRAEAVVDPQEVVNRLNDLADLLATQNPSRTNLELSLHIDTICCYQDGRVVVRTCKLGALAGSTELLAKPGELPSPDSSGDPAAFVAKPRRRTLRRVSDCDGDHAALQAAAHRAADVNRFAGLGDEWFWVDEFLIPGLACWAREHAEEVGNLRATGLSQQRIADRFEVTVPTVRHALRIWQANHPNAPPPPARVSPGRWEDDHVEDVLRLLEQGKSINEIAKDLDVSNTTVRKGLRLAQERKATAQPPNDSVRQSALE